VYSYSVSITDIEFLLPVTEERGGIIFSILCLSEASLIFQIWLDCHNYHEHMRIYMQLVGVCVCACVWLSALDNFKTIADNCFLFGSYVYWGNAWTIKSSHVKIIGKVKVIFSQGSRGIRLPTRCRGTRLRFPLWWLLQCVSKTGPLRLTWHNSVNYTPFQLVPKLLTLVNPERL